MTDERDVIAKRDWRLQAISTLAEDFVSPWTGLRHPAGSPVWATAFAKQNEELLQFALPNVAAMYLSIAQRALAQGASLLATVLGGPRRQTAEGTRIIAETSEAPFLDAIEYLSAGVIFSYSAVEAFANYSIPDTYVYERDREDDRCRETYTREQIERWLSLDVKLDKVLPQILSVSSPKGTGVWQEYAWLKELRDRLVHLKSADWRRSGPEEADGILWTRLLDTSVPRAAAIAARTIRHYLVGEPPRWMRRLPINTAT
jgi:hypothetical protein